MLSGPSASAYTHFLRYLTTRAPFTGLPQKYDLNALPNRTLSFYISDQGPAQLAANDSLTGVISEIRAAAKVWNDVETSELRLSFGGMTSGSVSSTGPGIDVVFTDDIPPGLVAQTGFSQLGEPSGGTFVPIVRSTVMLNRNIVDRPSFSEAFFLTAVHELGHAIGLQHSLVSGVMSTEPTRGTSKAKPLGADDIAGVSLLYPVRGFAAATGSISGRVTLGGEGVALASVVAIPASGDAVSVLTNPDGTFRIEGVPQGSYYVYAHPLPPARRDEARPANIEPPMGGDGRAIAAGPIFDTVFFPGSREPSFVLQVTPGGVVENVNFNVQRRAAAGINTVQTYNFVNQVTIKPPTVNRNTGRGTLVAAGSGLATATGTPVNGLNATVLGNAGVVVGGSLRPYLTAPYLQMDLNLSAALPEGPLHLLFTVPGDLYVLPSALLVASKAPPSITSLANATEGGLRVIQVTGTSFDRDTRVLFDGVAAAVRSFDEAAGRITVTAPPAPAGHRAAVVALNDDGQSSLFSQGNTPPVYTYDGGDSASFTVSPGSLPAGVESVVEVTGTGLNLIDGLAKLGFGSGDVVVRRVWVTGPNRLVASVATATQASGTVNATLVNGLQWATLNGALAIQPRSSASSFSLSSNVLNALTGQPSLTAGSPAIGFVTGAPAGTSAAQLSLTVNDQPVPVTNFVNGQISFVLPLSLQPGPAILRLRAGSEAAVPVVVGIDPPPAVVVNVSSGGNPVDAARPVRAGDVVTATVFGLVADAYTGLVTARQIVVNVAGVDHAAQSVVANQGRFDVTFTLGNVPAGNQAMVISQDGRPSAPAALAVR